MTKPPASVCRRRPISYCSDAIFWLPMVPATGGPTHFPSVKFNFVRVRRIELRSQPWEGRVLPLNDTRLFSIVPHVRFSILGESVLTEPVHLVDLLLRLASQNVSQGLANVLGHVLTPVSTLGRSRPTIKRYPHAIYSIATIPENAMYFFRTMSEQHPTNSSPALPALALTLLP